jgi:hypothetical protein
MNLKVPTYSTASMTAVGDERVLVAEASSLCGGQGIECGQLYDDACDVGIELVSHRTGQRARMHLVERPNDGDGIKRWEFEFCGEEVRRRPKLAGWKLHVLND